MYICNIYTRRKYFSPKHTSFNYKLFDHLLLGVKSHFLQYTIQFTGKAVLSWQSVLLVDETKVAGENHWSAARHWKTFSHKVLYIVSCTHCPWVGIKFITLAFICRHWLHYEDANETTIVMAYNHSNDGSRIHLFVLIYTLIIV